MHLALCSFAALAAVASAQSITSLLAATPELSNLTSLVSLYPDLVEALGKATGVTILAPSNQAFGAFLQGAGSQAIQNDKAYIKGLLTYHVLNGKVPAAAFKTSPAFIPTLLTPPALTNVTGGQVVEGFTKGQTIEVVSGLRQVSTVVKGDIKFDGGLVHIINKVLTVPRSVNTTATLGGLTNLAAALKATGLTKAIDTTPDLTVFAPDNAAFRKLGPAISKLTVQQLTDILGYHVVKGTIAYSSTLRNGESLKTLTGESVKISISGENVFVNDAKVLIPDILVANGVVHVIDSVLNSKSSSAGASNATGTSGTSTASAHPSGPSGTGSSYPPSNPTITPYIGSASGLKMGVLEIVALFAGTAFWLL